MILALILALGLALRVAFALLPLQTHLVLLEDDAWMVTAIARNFARGLGPSADGVSWTTGFQPLYPLTLGALPYVVAPDALDAGFTANLLICAALSALACVPGYALARRLGGERAGLFAAALLALNPFLIRLTVNGMETALGLLLLLTLFWAAGTLPAVAGGRSLRSRGVRSLRSLGGSAHSVRLGDSSANPASAAPERAPASGPPSGAAARALERAPASGPPSAARVVSLGVLTALAVLARLDASLAFAAIALTLILSPLLRTGEGLGVRGAKPRTGAGPGVRGALLYVVTTLLLLTPYFAFNYLVGGGLGPASGRALMFMQSYAGSFNLTNGLAAWLQNSALNLDPLPGLWPKLLVWLVLIGLFVRVVGRRALAALPLLLYLPVPPLYYGYYLQQIRERYFVGLSAVLIILLAWLLAELYGRARGLPGRLALLAALGGALLLNTAEPLAFNAMMRRSPDLTQPTSYQAARWIRDNLPPDARIGAKNSGIYQYYSGHTILNIDGKLNHRIVPQLERRTLLDYLRAERVTFLVDRETTMADHVAFYSAQFGPAPFHRTPSLGERFVIYGTLLLNRFGADRPVPVDRRDGFTPDPPFTAAADVLVRFTRPNQAANPVVVYQLRPAGAPGVP